MIFADQLRLEGSIIELDEGDAQQVSDDNRQRTEPFCHDLQSPEIAPGRRVRTHQLASGPSASVSW
ncbi:hypothetical protein B0G69_0119 [Paraburkholderia sp. RAU2J]|nr:hypothetical protein B0G69_0119 [Paraburkholderia sp. RAU2J]